MPSRHRQARRRAGSSEGCSRDDPGRSVLTKAGCAELLGVSVRTIQRLMRDDPNFPMRRVGRIWRGRREAVLEWLEKREEPRSA